jgi:hypothetical protein
MFGVVIPNRYEDIVSPLIESINRFTSDPKPEVVIVADGHRNNYGFRCVPYTDKHFAFSRSANLGIKALGRKDIVLLNDDCRLLEHGFFLRLAGMAHAHPDVGCVGNPSQRWHERKKHWGSDGEAYQDVTGAQFLCFPCVYIKRRMLDQIGLMNEGIVDYGFDDKDLCDRARAAGWRTTITRSLKIQHGDGSSRLGDGCGQSWSLSFARTRQ